MNNVLVCPNCQTTNSLDAANCAKCGTPLSGEPQLETIRVSDLTPEVQRPEPETAHELRTGTLALHVMGEKSPILIEGKETVILGRNVFGEDAPTIDLTNYHGRLLGVSRHHASIHISDDNYMLEDLHSSNGTWLNDVRLSPLERAILRNGDMIRLGQLVLFVHFQDTNLNGESGVTGDTVTTRRFPIRRGSAIGDIRSVTIRLVGKPERIEMYPDMVKATLLHVPENDSLPPGAPSEFHIAHTYTVYIPLNRWKKVEAAMTNPFDIFIVDGICTFTSSEGIAIYATDITSKQLQAQQTRLLTRRHKHGQRISRRANR
jgi:hypothetical protein